MRLPALPRIPGLARWLIVVGLGAAGTVAAAVSPRWLRRADAFRVRRVEVVGTRFLDAHDVLAATGIARGRASVFDDPSPWRERLLRLPQVQAAEIDRRLPSTLVVRVTEAEPIALARTPELVPVTAAGVVLPLRAGIELDLPLVDVAAKVGADGRLASPDALAVARTLDRLRVLDPELAAAVSEAQPLPGRAVRLVLRTPAGLEALVSAAPSDTALRHLHEALADVAGRGELARVRRIDARFTDQIVVAFNTEPGTRP